MNNPRFRSLLACLVTLAAVTAAPVLAAGGVESVPSAMPAAESPCSAAVAAGPLFVEPLPAATIICGACSEIDCVGKAITTACTTLFAEPGRCGANLNRCPQDNKFFCFCQPNEPQSWP